MLAPIAVVPSAAFRSNSSDVRVRGFASTFKPTIIPNTSSTKNIKPIQSLIAEDPPNRRPLSRTPYRQAYGYHAQRSGLRTFRRIYGTGSSREYPGMQTYNPAPPFVQNNS